ncbi:MAG: hypothetical protein HY820_02070 [Acidobacteria bacterium]|nr:hypothetical protein [Acidobacteriota bacterium]
MPTHKLHRRCFLGAAATSLLPAQTRQVAFATAGFEEIARMGTVFRRAYTGCSDPNRSGLLTGVYPHSGKSGFSLEGRVAGAGYMFRQYDGPPPLHDMPPSSIVVCAKPGGSGGFRESEVNMPFAILPSIGQPGPSDQLVSAVDIVPTVLAMCGLQIPPDLHGHNLLKKRPEWVCMEGKLGQPGEWRAIVRGYEKLVVNRNGDVTHLFNLSEDPEEADNLATHYDKSLQIRRTADALNALLVLWRRQTNDGRSGSGLKTRGKK